MGVYNIPSKIIKSILETQPRPEASEDMRLRSKSDFALKCIEAYKQHEIPLIASSLDVPPVEVSRTLRKSGVLKDIQSFELAYIVKNINVIPQRAISEYLGLAAFQLDQVLRRYRIRSNVKEKHMTREICIAGTRWLIEERLKLPINDQLPRFISSAHFTDNGLYPAVAFATANKAKCPTAKHFSACAFLICAAYPDRFKPWQFRHAKQNEFFSGESGGRNLLDALLWLTDVKMGIPPETLPYVMESNNFLNTRTLQEYGLGPHMWRKHWSSKGLMLAAFAKAAGVKPLGKIVRKATGQTKNLRQPRRIVAPQPASSPIKILEDQAKKLMAKEFDLQRGSQTLAREFSERHSLEITLHRLAQLFDEVRGKTLSPGRPRGSRKSIPLGNK